MHDGMLHRWIMEHRGNAVSCKMPGSRQSMYPWRAHGRKSDRIEMSFCLLRDNSKMKHELDR